MCTFQAYLGATEAALVYCLEPVFTAILAVSGIVPGVREFLGPVQIAGGGLIIAAMLLAELGPRLFGSSARATGDPTGDSIG